jgi:hypothetical protein
VLVVALSENQQQQLPLSLDLGSHVLVISESSCSSCLHWFAGHGRLRPCAVVYLFVARPLHTMRYAIVLGDTVSSAGRYRKVLLMKRVR